MWLLRWKKPSELRVNTETALPPVPTSHGGIERKVVAEGLQGGEAHHVDRHVDRRDRLFVWVLPTEFMIEPQMDSVTGSLRHVQGRRADKKLARGEVPPLLLKIDGVVGLETAFAFLKMAPGS